MVGGVRPTVLVAATEEGAGDLIVELLRAEGYEVLHEMTTAAALTVVSQRHVDIVIADVEPDSYSDAFWDPVHELRDVSPVTAIIISTSHIEATEVPPEQAGVKAVLLK